MTRTELTLDIAAIIHSGKQFNSDPASLAEIIVDHLELMDALKEDNA